MANSGTVKLLFCEWNDRSPDKFANVIETNGRVTMLKCDFEHMEKRMGNWIKWDAMLYKLSSISNVFDRSNVVCFALVRNQWKLDKATSSLGPAADRSLSGYYETYVCNNVTFLYFFVDKWLHLKHEQTFSVIL